MAIVTVDILKEELALTPDLGTADDALLARKIDAAQAHIERGLGYKITDRFGGVGQDAIPADLAQAVCMLAGHWFENREGTLVGVSAQVLPMGVSDIIDSHRDWSF